ncbi:hypothetical protein [Salipiger sp.]|uniref:hypothetical protein n=1 Tax=Salipiger sp. TaxID=2078585 RepID=UPI003A972AED
MTHVDTARPGVRSHRRPVPAHLLAAAVLLLGLGIPALFAPASQIAPDGWHGNSARAQALR